MTQHYIPPTDQVGPSPEAVRRALADSRVIPAALTVTCPVCHAPEGTRCWQYGIHKERVRLSH